MTLCMSVSAPLPLPPPGVSPSQDSYGGFLDGQLAEDFLYYADVVFSSLGSLVQHWLTFSDPMAICGLGYGLGAGAPGMSHGAAGQYACGHTLLLAHGRAVQLYRLKYAGAQAGRVSIALSAHWGLPADQSSAAGARGNSCSHACMRACVHARMALVEQPRHPSPLHVVDRLTD